MFSAIQSSRWISLIKGPVAAIALGGAFLVCAYLSTTVIVNASGRSALWLSNALLISGVVLLRDNRWRGLALGSSAAFLYAWMLSRGANPVTSLVTALIPVTICGFAAWLTLKVLKTPQIRNIKQALKLLFLVIIPTSLLSGVVSTAWPALLTGADFWTPAIQWFVASVAGVSMILPTTLILATPNRIRTAPKGWVNAALLTAALGGVILAPFAGLFLLSLLLIFPLANIFALRAGGRVTAFTMTLTTLWLFIYPFVDTTAAAPSSSEAAANAVTFGFQLYIIAVFYNGLLTSLAIDHQTRIKRQLEQRTRIARVARAKALEASKAKTQFLAAMSHELRTPLNGVMGFAEVVLQRKTLPKDVRRNVELIRRSGDALALVVGDIIDYSNMTDGVITLNPRPVVISDVAENALQIASADARTKGLEISSRVEGDDRQQWLLDDGRVQQVLLNLLNNAVKFTDAGKVELYVRVARGCARFEIHDTGAGVPEEKLPYLFDRFTQADDVFTRSNGGAGLGLAICKSIVDLMGGEIGAQSRVGHGSTFWFEIPLEAAAATTTEGGAQDEGRSAHILVVDDHPVNRELAVTVLNLLGCTSDTAENGAEALEAVKTTRYDAVLMDVHMPVMDGIAATRAIRALDGPAGRIPIVGLSADVLPESVQRCNSAGMTNHLGKPVNVQKLQDALLRALSEDGPEKSDQAVA